MGVFYTRENNLSPNSHLEFSLLVTHKERGDLRIKVSMCEATAC